MTDTARATRLRSPGILLAAGLSVLWVAVAGIRPETTYHLAPLLVAATPAAFSPGGRQGALVRVLVGLGLASASGVIIWRLGGLRGPTIGPFSSATQETMALALVGALVGAAWSWRISSD